MRRLLNDIRGAEAPLTADIEDDEIVIRIGIGTLAWAFDHMEENNPWSDDKRDFVQAWRVCDPLEFAKDVVCELTNEEEDGSHPLNRLLDKVSNAAADQGSLGIEESTDGKSAYARDYETEEGESMSEILKFEGDLFWNADDHEQPVYDPDDELDNIGDVGVIVEFEQAKRLPNFYGVDCGEDPEGRIVCLYFDTLEEAEECSKKAKEKA